MAGETLGEAERRLLARYRSRAGERLALAGAVVIGLLLVGGLAGPVVYTAGVPAEGREEALRTALPLGVGIAVALGVSLGRAARGWRLRRLVRRMAERLDAIDPAARPLAEAAGVLLIGVAGVLIAVGLVWLVPRDMQ
jgi:hypothetical protein